MSMQAKGGDRSSTWRTCFGSVGRQYLPELHTCQKWLHVSRNFVPGDTVFLVDETAPRNSWGIGKGLQSVPDEEGLVYWVCVNIKTSELDRCITKVCLLHDAE